jgi:hypothetical protein
MIHHSCESTVELADRVALIRRRGVLLLVGMLAVGLGGSRAVCAGEAAKGGEVHGSVHAELGDERDIVPLHGFFLSLKGAQGHIVASTRTDVYGRFLFPRQPSGSYYLSWDAPGWIPASSDPSDQIQVQEETRYLPPVSVKPQKQDSHGLPLVVLHGRVKMMDGSPPWFADEFFGINQAGRVTVKRKDGEGLSGGAVLANAGGEFVVAGVPMEPVIVEARLVQRRRSDKGWTDWELTEKAPPATAEVSGQRPKGESNVVDLRQSLTIQARSPRLVSVSATVDGKRVLAVRGGTEVKCYATLSARTADHVHFAWKVPGYVATSADGTFSWKVPERVGRQTAYVLAEGETGGFAVGRVTFPIGDKTVLAPPAPPNIRRDSGRPGAARERPLGPPLAEERATFAGADLPAVPKPGPDSFLTRKRPGTLEIAENYYRAVDPQSKRTTLKDWKTVNGFDQGASVVRAAYLNNNDLGSGRDIRMLQNESNMAAYVTNFGKFDRDPLNADRALTGKVQESGATVCMEYSPVEGHAAKGPIVKFYVYESADPSAKRLPSADLDNNGPKFVPNLCLDCHGGDYDAVSQELPRLDQINLKSSFREFDLDTFRFPRPSTRADHPSRLVATPAEQQVFKKLNELVVTTKPAHAIQDLIANWYKNGNVQDTTWVPPGWKDAPKEGLYRDVVAKSCRTCHIALSNDTSRFGLNWTSFDQFKQYRPRIKQDIYGEPKSMPHAKITYENFWSEHSPTRADILKKFQLPGWPPF